MKISVCTECDVDKKSLVVFGLLEGDLTFSSDLLSDQEVESVNGLLKSCDFVAKKNSVLYLPTPLGAAKGIVLLGLGKEAELTTKIVRESFGKAVPVVGKQKPEHLVIVSDLLSDAHSAAALEAILLGSYKYEVFKSEVEDQCVIGEICFLSANKRPELAEILKVAKVTTEAANWCRDLGNSPANELTPVALATKCGIIAESDLVELTVLGEDEMKELGMNSLLSVSAGSVEEAQLIILDYKHHDAKKTISLVGKGVTFDSGGISIKPSASMEQMKFDMCGSAAVLGAMKALVELEPAINIVCAVAATENMPGPNATRPGDIVTAYNGKTIEIYNTDAEGRLILADALAYVVDVYKPEVIVDVATLTGAAIVALGHNMAAVLGNDDESIKQLQSAGNDVNERLWQFPFSEEYTQHLKGTDADLCNIGPAREAGTIYGGAFLSNFIGETKWVHLDIAGTGWGMKGCSYITPKLASGFGARLLAKWVLDISK